MAERLKKKLLETDKLVDVVVGPDAYRDLPRLLRNADNGQAGMNVILSADETYADVAPVRVGSNGVHAFV
jgi:tRNA-2-methylthio-N6-dimethylallyladenosine synthase